MVEDEECTAGGLELEVVLERRRLLVDGGVEAGESLGKGVVVGEESVGGVDVDGEGHWSRDRGR